MARLATVSSCHSAVQKGHAHTLDSSNITIAIAVATWGNLGQQRGAIRPARAPYTAHARCRTPDLIGDGNRAQRRFCGTLDIIFIVMALDRALGQGSVVVVGALPRHGTTAATM
jgi:hypothetical protein